MPDTSSAGALAGTQWRLSVLNDTAVIEGSQATLNFGADGRATGSDGCNRFFGPYRAADDVLTFGPLAGTMMACPPALMAQARQFTRALESTQTFVRSEGVLTLKDAAGVTLATFIAQRVELAGSAWDVISYNNGRQAVVSVLAGTAITLAFSEDGRVAGSAGCNPYTGSFTQSEGAIAFSPLASTRKLCPEPEGVMAQETQFLLALATAAICRMDGDRLELRTKDNALAVSLRRAA